MGPYPGSNVHSSRATSLFLLSDGVDYYARLVDIAGKPDEDERAAVRVVLERYHQRAQVYYEIMRSTGSVTAQDIEQLVALWHDLWSTLEEAVSPGLWERISALAG